MKRFIAIVLACFVFLLCSGCGSAMDIRTDRTRQHLNAMGFEIVELLGSYTASESYLVYDTRTMVIYIYHMGYGFCPYYDEFGNIMFYEGE